LNYGTLYPALLKLEQEARLRRNGCFGEQAESEVLPLTKAGRKQIEREEKSWAERTATIGRFLAPSKGEA
jgi:DNA-binding PadR family transcriptional regulator